LTAQWTCDVTRLYRQIATQVPQSGFEPLAKLMRTFAVAKLIVARNAAEESGLDLAYLLDKHRITPVKVAREWDGVAHAERVERHGEDSKSRWVRIINMPMCGGVEFAMDSSNLKTVPDVGRIAQAIAQRVIASRTSAVAAFWPISRG
jgi:hypothetical protein